MVGVDVVSLVGWRDAVISAFDWTMALPSYGPRAAVTGSAILLGLLVGLIVVAVIYWRRR